MTVSENIKTVNNKIEQNKAQCNLDRQTVKILALSSANVSKYEFLTGKDVLLEKEMLQKAITIKSFEYVALDTELKKQTDIAKKQYQNQIKEDKTKNIEKKKKRKTLLSQIYSAVINLMFSNNTILKNF